MIEEDKLIKVLIVDDHAVTRKGVKFFIENDPQIKVVAEASNGQESIDLSLSLAPNVVLMDVTYACNEWIDGSKSYFFQLS